MVSRFEDFQRTSLDFQRTSLDLKNKISKQFSELMAALNRSRDDKLCDDRSPLDRYSPSSQKVKGCGSEGLERSLNDEELVETEVETKASGIEDRFMKPIYEIKSDKEIPKASSMSKRRYKLQKRISCEELDERTMKGLCVFCEEPETPGHYLQHMNSCLLMIDSEDHLSDSMVNKIGNEISSDRWLSNSISCESESDETDNDEDRVPSDSDLVVNDIEKESRLEVVTDKKESMEVDTSEVEHKTESGRRAEEPPKSAADEVHVQSIELVVRDQAQEARSDVVSSPGVNVTRVGAVETQTCISRLANHVWKPGEFVHLKIQLDWLERADSNQEKESNKKLRKLKLHQGRKSHKTWMFKYKSEFPRHYGFDIEAFFGVEFYELEYRKLHINHCFEMQEFSGIHGSISGPWHLAFDPGGIITCTECDDFVVTHTQWVGHAKFEGCSNVQTLATDVDVEEKQAWIENAWFKSQVFSDFDIASWIGLEIYSWKYKKQINIGHISLNGMCNKLVYDEEKKKLRHVGDDVKKGKNSFLRDVKIILALAVKEYRMGKADERLLPGHYRLLHTFDQRGGLKDTVIAGTIMHSSLKLFHQLRVACLHHTSLGFLYGSLPRPPEENHSNFSIMLQYHETWSCSSLRTNRVWDPGG